MALWIVSRCQIKQFSSMPYAYIISSSITFHKRYIHKDFIRKRYSFNLILHSSVFWIILDYAVLSHCAVRLCAHSLSYWDRPISRRKQQNYIMKESINKQYKSSRNKIRSEITLFLEHENYSFEFKWWFHTLTPIVIDINNN